MPMTRFLTLFDTVVTDPLEDIPTVNELEKWLKNVGEQAFYFLIRLAAAGLLLFIGSKLIKFLMNRFKRSKLYQKMDPGLASFTASGSRIVLYIILILMCFGVLILKLQRKMRFTEQESSDNSILHLNWHGRHCRRF